MLWCKSTDDLLPLWSLLYLKFITNTLSFCIALFVEASSHCMFRQSSSNHVVLRYVKSNCTINDMMWKKVTPLLAFEMAVWRYYVISSFLWPVEFVCSVLVATRDIICFNPISTITGSSQSHAKFWGCIKHSSVIVAACL